MSQLRNGRRTLLTAALLVAALAASTGPASATVATVDDDGGVGITVVGGHAASEPYPAMASLQMPYRGDPAFHFCAATLVSRLWAVTNAHCVTTPSGAVAPPGLLHLRIGSHSRIDGGTYVGVAAVLPHASWDWATGPNPVADIAMLNLDTFVQSQPIEIATRLAHSRQAVTRLLGWGVTEPSGQAPALPIELQELDTRLVPQPRCAAAFISAGEICVHNPHGTDGACYGDSGGPALQKVTADRWQVVGGASRGTTEPFCGTGPTVYTDLTYYRPWIYQVMRTGTVPPPAPEQEPTPPQPGTTPTLHWGLPNPA